MKKKHFVVKWLKVSCPIKDKTINQDQVLLNCSNIFLLFIFIFIFLMWTTFWWSLVCIISIIQLQQRNYKLTIVHIRSTSTISIRSCLFVNAGFYLLCEPVALQSPISNWCRKVKKWFGIAEIWTADVLVALQTLFL